MMLTLQTQPVLAPVEVNRWELEQSIRKTYEEKFGEDEIMNVRISRFPHEYGALVLFHNPPPQEALDIAEEQGEQFRLQGIPIGILVLQESQDK